MAANLQKLSQYVVRVACEAKAPFMLLAIKNVALHFTESFSNWTLSMRLLI
jgi:hypothetical protein